MVISLTVPRTSIQCLGDTFLQMPVSVSKFHSVAGILSASLHFNRVNALFREDYNSTNLQGVPKMLEE